MHVKYIDKFFKILESLTSLRILLFFLWCLAAFFSGLPCQWLHAKDTCLSWSITIVFQVSVLMCFHTVLQVSPVFSIWADPFTIISQFLPSRINRSCCWAADRLCSSTLWSPFRVYEVRVYRNSSFGKCMSHRCKDCQTWLIIFSFSQIWNLPSNYDLTETLKLSAVQPEHNYHKWSANWIKCEKPV